LAVLGSGQRLAHIKKDLLDFDLPSLLEDATKIVVWMKTTEGKMQYIDTPASIAMNCYAAGHSLYFNPSLEIQQKYLRSLSTDLNMDFGLEKDGGGDLEIFAVNG
jgi:hypothetical protein